jgi:hypothetical protein
MKTTTTAWLFLGIWMKLSDPLLQQRDKLHPPNR